MKKIELLSALAVLTTISSGVEIQCEYYNETYASFGTFYKCNCTVITMDNPTIVTEISGNHLAGKSNKDVKAFVVGFHKNVTTIPKGIEKFFENLEQFTWYSGNISTIDANIFKPFPNLLRINLGDNKLVTLAGDLFQYTRKLQEVCFGENLLEHVGHDILTGLTDLRYAGFNSNPCIDVWADKPQKIQELIHQLAIKCPPDTST